MKKLNKAGPSTDPWGTPLVTSLQLDSAPLNAQQVFSGAVSLTTDKTKISSKNGEELP